MKIWVRRFGVKKVYRDRGGEGGGGAGKKKRGGGEIDRDEELFGAREIDIAPGTRILGELVSADCKVGASLHSRFKETWVLIVLTPSWVFC